MLLCEVTLILSWHSWIPLRCCTACLQQDWHAGNA